MEYKMKEEEFSYYTKNIQHPSALFNRFVNDYIAGSAIIGRLGEEDISVWSKMSGVELETAKQIIMDVLTHTVDISYIRATGIFRDKRAEPILRSIAQDENNTIVERLHAAKSLYFISNDHLFFDMLENACRNTDDKAFQTYLRCSIRLLLEGLNEKQRKKFLSLLYQ